MAIYELRTYHVMVGKMAEVVSLYKSEGWPALEKHPHKLVSYFTGDIGALNQLVHLWKFMEFAQKIRPLMLSQENKLLMAAPWGPTL